MDGFPSAWDQRTFNSAGRSEPVGGTGLYAVWPLRSFIASGLVRDGIEE